MYAIGNIPSKDKEYYFIRLLFKIKHYYKHIKNVSCTTNPNPKRKPGLK